MNWVTIIWSMVASACLTLALTHLLIWLKRRQAWASLLFFVSATGTSLLALDELWMMRSQSIAEYTSAIRWLHPPAFLVIVALVGFVRVYMRAGRRWLAWAVLGVRAVSLVLNFILTPNLNYSRITGLHQVQFFGDSVSVVEGVPSRWMLVGQFSFILWIIFVADAAVSVWRRGERRRALTLGGSIIFFAIVGSVYAVLTLWKVIDYPVMASLFYMAIILSMAYELSYDSARAIKMGQDLEESEHRMELAAEAAHLGVWVRDLTSNEIWASDRWRSMFGFSKSEPLNLNLLLQQIHPHDRDTFRQVLAEVQEGKGYETEYRVLLPSGKVCWIASRGQVELNDRGKPVRVLGLSIDITQRKVAELEAQQQRWELAHLSRVTMLGELSGSMAHELNQPLMAILSNAQAAQRFMAHEDVDLDEVRDILADIVDQDNRAGEIIHRLRLLLKKGEVQQQPVDVNDAVREVLRLIHGDLVNQGVTTHTELAPVLPTVNGDRVQLQQVLLNLLMNASDAMSQNGPANRQIVIRTELADGLSVRFSVSDCGIGVDPGKLEEVFEPFFSTKAQGLGLGLSVCRTIISAHAGKLWAINNPDGGATFSFTLPVNSEAAPS
ncbi:MAG: ATP-binding protein [Pyrinomonadaceae bacterium]|nr:ATP-binding protein [Pyrinomonadaceae bacterium]